MNKFNFFHNGALFTVEFYPCGNYARVTKTEGGKVYIKDVHFNNETLWTDFVRKLENIQFV